MKKTTNPILGIILALLLISIALNIFALVSMLESLRVTFGSIFVLFLPGFIITYIFFPKTIEFEEKGKHDKIAKQSGSGIDWIERIALSFALSIAIVPLAVFYLNLAGIKINLLNSFLTILGIIIISLIILKIKQKNIN